MTWRLPSLHEVVPSYLPLTTYYEKVLHGHHLLPVLLHVFINVCVFFEGAFNNSCVNNICELNVFRITNHSALLLCFQRLGLPSFSNSSLRRQCSQKSSRWIIPLNFVMNSKIFAKYLKMQIATKRFVISAVFQDYFRSISIIISLLAHLLQKLWCRKQFLLETQQSTRLSVTGWAKKLLLGWKVMKTKPSELKLNSSHYLLKSDCEIHRTQLSTLTLEQSEPVMETICVTSYHCFCIPVIGSWKISRLAWLIYQQETR